MAGKGETLSVCHSCNRNGIGLESNVKNFEDIEHYHIVYADGSRARMDTTFFAYDEDKDLVIFRGLNSFKRIAPVFLSGKTPNYRKDVSYISFVDGKK